MKPSLAMKKTFAAMERKIAAATGGRKRKTSLLQHLEPAATTLVRE